MSETSYAQLSGEYNLDPAHSRIGFTTRHAMVTKVRGSFTEFTGTAHVDGEKPSNSTVQVNIKATSIDTGHADRDTHLRGNDFLKMEEFPELTFVSTSVVRSGETTFEVTGDLTIRGVTRSVTVPFEFAGSAKDPFGFERIGFEGTASINRKDFGITYNAVLETGGVLIGEKVTLEFDISAVRNV